MKKITKKLLALVMLLSIFIPSIVMAADIPKMKVDVKDEVKLNDEFKVKVSFDPDAKANIDIKVTYDPKVLEVVNDGKDEIKKDGFDFKHDDNSLTYVNTNNDGVTVTFKAIAAGDAKINVKVLEMFLKSEDRLTKPNEVESLNSTKVVKIKGDNPSDNQTTNNNNSELNKDSQHDKNNQDTVQKDDSNNVNKSIEKKGFVKNFIDKVKSDWVLMILFIAIVCIVIILIILIIETIITSGKAKKEKLKETQPDNQDIVRHQNRNIYDVNINNSRVRRSANNRSNMLDEYSNDGRRAPLRNRSNYDRDMDMPARRPLTEEERHQRAMRMRRMNNGETRTPRRPLSPEQKRQLEARRKMRAQQNPDIRRPRRPKIDE